MPAAVRFETPSQKLGGMLCDDLALLRRQDDGAEMFSASPVLGKKNGDGVGNSPDDAVLIEMERNAETIRPPQRLMWPSPRYIPSR